MNCGCSPRNYRGKSVNPVYISLYDICFYYNGNTNELTHCFVDGININIVPLINVGYDEIGSFWCFY